MRLCLSLALLTLSLSAGKEIEQVGKAPVKKPVGSNDEYFVLRDSSGWYVRNATRGTQQRVQPHCIDPNMRNMKQQDFVRFLNDNDGYVEIGQYDDGSYRLSPKQRVRGDGPIAGVAGYWATKVIGYALPITGIVTAGYQSAKAGNEGCFPHEVDINTPDAKSTINRCSGIATKSVGAPRGTAEASKAMVTIGAHEHAADGTVAAATAGIAGCYISWVESAATAVGGALASCPWLP